MLGVCLGLRLVSFAHREVCFGGLKMPLGRSFVFHYVTDALLRCPPMNVGGLLMHQACSEMSLGGGAECFLRALSRLLGLATGKLNGVL